MADDCLQQAYAIFGDVVVKKDVNEEMRKEFNWLQRVNAAKSLDQTLMLVKECCVRMNVAAKCEPYLKLEHAHPVTENLTLQSKNGADSLKAKLSLLGDNVIQAEVQIKHPKGPGGVYRGVAQPDVQWKLQQLQDTGNQIARAACILQTIRHKVATFEENSSWNEQSGVMLLEAVKQAKASLISARNCVMLPRKRSLSELFHFPPTKKFAPALPQDIFLSFYVSGTRLVCASYQVPLRQTNNSTSPLSKSSAECQIPYLADVLAMMGSAISHLETLTVALETLRKRVGAVNRASRH